MKTTDTDSVYEIARICAKANYWAPKPKSNRLAYLSLGLSILALAISLSQLFKTCSDRNNPTRPDRQAFDSLKIENAKLKQALSSRSARIDTVIKRIPYAVESAVKYYDWSVTVSPDTCHTYIANYKRLRDVTDSLLVTRIQLQDSSISDLKTVVINQDVMLRNDSVYIVCLQDSIVAVRKAGKWKYWKGLVQGVGIGVAIDRGIQLIKP